MSVSNNTSLRDVIQSDLGEPSRTGRRPYWCCPFHDDRTPSLTLTPDGCHWKCFGCGKSGDAISWVREQRGFSFPQAVSFLQAGGHPLASSEPRVPRRRNSINREDQSSSALAKHGADIVDYCARQLESSTGLKARVWLRARGLHDDTIQFGRLGYNSKDQRLGGVFVKRGITIPWFEENLVCGIKVRRPGHGPKYVWVAGSRRCGLFLGQEAVAGRPALLVEGEFDALLGWQELREQVNVATLGSAMTTPDTLSLAQLLPSPVLLVCYDSDEAGTRGSSHWLALTSRAMKVRFPFGKDLSEFVSAGGNLRAWLEDQLSHIDRSTTRHPTDRMESAPSTCGAMTYGVG